MSEETKPKEKPTEIVEREELFAISDKRDEEQIQKELMGELVSTMIYQFPQAGREVVGLSWVGVKEAARHHGGIVVENPVITEDDEKYTVLVKAKDVYNNIEMWGVSQQKKIMDTKYGEKEDIFALQKALSKAQRNAIRQLLPEKYITMILDRFAKGEKLPEKKKSGVWVGKRTPEEAPEVPAPQPEPKAAIDETTSQQEWLDYKKSPIAQLILQECDVPGGLEEKELIERLIVRGFTRPSIRNVVELLKKDGLLAWIQNRLSTV